MIQVNQSETLYIRATNQMFSGTVIMMLVQHLLIEIGVRTCSLINCAKVRYEGGSVPLIYLRCIRGKTTDWYSDFGYFNGQKAQIATEMRRIHDSPYRNTSFGPWLLALWNQANKTDFDSALKKNDWRFLHLRELRDSGYWVARLYPPASGETHRRQKRSQCAMY